VLKRRHGLSELPQPVRRKAALRAGRGSPFWQAEFLLCTLHSEGEALQPRAHAPAGAAGRGYLPFPEKERSFLNSLQ